MRIRSSHVLFSLFVWLVWALDCRAPTAASSLSRARSLDALLQDYAYRAFHRPRTGVSYPAIAPSNLTGIEIAAMRLRSGSLRRYEVKYNEFHLPTGVREQPYVERLVLVYQNLRNWSARYYAPPPGHMFLAPVLGLLAYNASNLSATNLRELNIEASRGPITIRFQNVTAKSDAKCVIFGLNGGFRFSDLTAGGSCSTLQQGHFSIVAVSLPPPPAGGGRKSKVWIIVGSVAGGSFVLVSLGCLALCVRKYRRDREMQLMERASAEEEALHLTSVGSMRAPTATSTRTQPSLESEYVQ